MVIGMVKKSWTMNCVLAGAEAYVLSAGGDQTATREKIRSLSSELSGREVDYLVMRIAEIVKNS